MSESERLRWGELPRAEFVDAIDDYYYLGPELRVLLEGAMEARDNYNRASVAELRAARTERDTALQALKVATRLLAVATDGGMTDYTEAPNGPTCGFCGYEVRDCEMDVRDADDVTPQPCPGVEARSFLKLVPHE